MPRLLKNLKGEDKKPYDETHKIVSLHFVITIVNVGGGDPIMFMLMKQGVSAQFIQRGEGTATKDIYDLLGAADNQKEVVYSIVPDNKIDDVMNELNEFFRVSKKKAGIAFSIPLSAISGRTAYHFLTHTVE